MSVTLSTEDLRRAVAEVRAHPRAPAMSALAFDVLSRQAEGHSLFAGKKFMRKRTQAHGLKPKETETGLGSLLGILERGPKEPTEWALLGAFAVAGFGYAFASESSDARPGLAARFARHLVWLEISTEHQPAALAELLLETEPRAALHGALAKAALEESDRGPRARAHNACRLGVLGLSESESARAALSRVRAEAEDDFDRALARWGLGEAELSVPPDSPSEAPPEPAVRLSGRLGRAPTAGIYSLLRWLSGWALLARLLSIVGFVLGVRREASLELRADALGIERRTLLLGRAVRRSEEVLRLSELRACGRRVRYPALNLIVGACCLSIGVLLGGFFVSDAVRSGQWVLLAVAAGLWMGGLVLDLALDVLMPGSRGRVAFDLSVDRKPSLCIAGVPADDADRFLRLLAARIQG